MNNILRFPMNAWDLKKINCDEQFSPEMEFNAPFSTHNHKNLGNLNVQDKSLLKALLYLQKTLGQDASLGDAQTLESCQAAAKQALEAAQNMERALVQQTLHIKEMTKIAGTDQLTGVYNRRGFEQEFKRVLSAATRYGEQGVLIYVDLDGFKPINDTYGHAAGDEMLVEVGRILNEHIRPHDTVARLGGDEFAILLTRTNWQDGLNRAERIERILNTHYLSWNGKHIAMRASLGFQCFGANADADTLLHKADDAMYQAKRLRNQSR